MKKASAKECTAFVAFVAAIVLVAGCGSSSTGGTAAAATTSASVASSTPSSATSVEDSDTAGSEAQSSMGSSSESSESSAEESMEPSTEESTESSTEESTTTSTSAASALDSASTKWLTTYCTSFQPILGLTGLQTQITAAKGDLVKIRALVVNAFKVSGAALTTLSTRLKGEPAPTLTKAGSNLPGLLGKAAALGATLTADGKKIAATNPAKDPLAFSNALQKYAPDLNRFSTDLGASAGLKIPFAALKDIKKIRSCDKVITLA